MPNNEFAGRREQVVGGLAERKLDALVSFGPNLRYLSGFTGSNGLLLVTARQTTLFTDPRYTLQAGQETDCPVRIAKGPLVDDLASALARLRPRRLGYEPAMMSCEAFQALEGGSRHASN